MLLSLAEEGGNGCPQAVSWAADRTLARRRRRVRAGLPAGLGNRSNRRGAHEQGLRDAMRDLTGGREAPEAQGLNSAGLRAIALPGLTEALIPA